MNHFVRHLFTVTSHTAGKSLRRDKNHDSHSRRGSGRGLYANVDQSPLSGRGYVTPLDQSGRLSLNRQFPTTTYQDILMRVSLAMYGKYDGIIY